MGSSNVEYTEHQTAVPRLVFAVTFHIDMKFEYFLIPRGIFCK